MRNLTPSQAASFTGDLLTICGLVEIYLNDGTVVCLTDHDVDLGKYSAAFGLDMSAVTMELGGTGTTGTFNILPNKGTGAGITYQQLEGGLVDSCIVKCYWCDYTVTPLDPIQICQGYVNEIKYGDSATVEIDFESKLNIVGNVCNDVMSSTCRADFGDATCKVDINPMVDGPHVFAPIDSQSFQMTRDEITPLGYYNNGTIYFKTGQNKGLGYEILTVSAADENGRETIYTKVPLAFDVAFFDYFLLYPGCDKVITSGCSYWNNTNNFQGEPFAADTSNILPDTSNTTLDVSAIVTGLPTTENYWLSQYLKAGFGVTALFAAGTRLTASGSFNDTLLDSTAYGQIYSLLGGATSVAADDGTLTPVDVSKVAALEAIGFKVPLNLNTSPVAIANTGIQADIDIAVAQVFYSPVPTQYVIPSSSATVSQ